LDRYLSVERCVGTDGSACSGVFGPIVESGFVCSDRLLSVERWVGTDRLVWSGGLRPIFEC